MRQSKVSVHTLRIIINFWEVLVIIGVKNQYLFLILVLFSGPAFADTFHAPGQNEIIEETIYWAEIAVYDVPYSTWHNNLEETISLLLKVTTPITEVTGIYQNSGEIVIPISEC